MDWSEHDWLDVCYNTNTQRFVLAYSDDANSSDGGYVYFKVGTYNSTNDNIDWGNEYDYFESNSHKPRTTFSGSYSCPKLAASTEDGTVCMIWNQGAEDVGQSTGWALGLVTNSSNNNLTTGTHTPMPIISTLDHAYPNDIIYNSDHSTFIALWQDDPGSGTAINTITVSTSDGETTQSKIQNVLSSNASGHNRRIAYDPVAKYFVIIKQKSNAELHIGSFTFGGVLTDGSNLHLFETWPVINELARRNVEDVPSSDTSPHRSFFFNPDTSEFTYPYCGGTDEDGRMVRIARDKYGGLVTPTKNPPYATDNAQITLRKSQEIADIGTADSNDSGPRWAVYDTGSNKIILMIRTAPGNIILRAKVVDPATPSNINNQFLGFSTAQCNNGSTATIAVSSNTVTQSGLIPTSTYYVRGADAALTTSDTDAHVLMDPVKVGKAVSSTKLLLT